MAKSTTKQGARRQVTEAVLKSFAQVLTVDMFEGLPGKTPGESAKLVPPVVFWLMACVVLTDGHMASAVISHWAVVHSVYAPVLSLRVVTDAAFCMARRALSLAFFEELFRRLLQRFTDKFGGRFRWKGFRLRTIDGSLIDLPAGAKKLLKEFCPGENKLGPGKHPQALLVGLLDVWSGVVHAFSLGSSKVGEVESAQAVLPSLGSEDLLMGDRNFACLPMFCGVLKRGSQFVMRLASNRFQGEGYSRTRLGPNEWLTTLKLNKFLRDKYPDLPERITVRIIRYQIPGYRPAYLITSLLDPRQFSWTDLVKLYHERWRQETAHREWKHTLQLSNIRSKSPEQVRKEVYVQLILNNTIRWLMAEAGDEKVSPVDLSFIQAKRLAEAASKRMAVVTSAKDTLTIYRQLLREIRREEIVIRPGRHFARRKNETKGRNKGNGTIALSSKLPTNETVEFTDGYQAGVLDLFHLAPMKPTGATMTI